MVNKYKAQPNEIRNDSHFTLPGDIEYVLATDYAILEAELKDVRDAAARLKMGLDHVVSERDEWKEKYEEKRFFDFDGALDSLTANETIKRKLSIQDIRDLAHHLCEFHSEEFRAVQAERDEWKRRCEKICNWIDNNNDNGAGEAIYAIAKGRDDG